MKKYILSALSLSLIIASAFGSNALTAAAEPLNIVVNGDFETGDFSNWTVYQTPDGVADEGIVEFDTTGSGTSYAAKFKVGTFRRNVYEGGGIYQDFYAPAGDWEVSADIAAFDPGGTGNLQGGRFDLLIDDVVVATYEFGFIQANQTLRHTLSVTGSFADDNWHVIKIEITRSWAAQSPTPMQYVDNINLIMPTANILSDSGVPGQGINEAPGLQKPFNPNSAADEHAGKKDK